MKKRWFNHTAIVALVAACSLVTAACGSESSDETKGSDGGGESSAAVADATAAVKKAYGGTFREPSAEGPAAQKNKNIWVLTCVSAAPGCFAPAQAVKNAGKTLGWDVTIGDGKADPAAQTAVIKQAIADGADGIITVAVDCPAIKNGLIAAKSAGIPVVGTYAFDCNDPLVGGNEQLFASTNIYGSSAAEYYTEWGKVTADYVIAKTDGKAKVITHSVPGYVSLDYRVKGFEEELKKCASCEILDKVTAPSADTGSGALAQKVQTTLQKNPTANTLVMASDSTMLGVAQVAARAKASNDKLLVVGGEGNLANMDLIRQGSQDASVGIPSEWLGWAAADGLNRVLAGEASDADEGLGFRIIDKDNNLPSAGQLWEVPVDYEAAYQKLWTAN